MLVQAELQAVAAVWHGCCQPSHTWSPASARLTVLAAPRPSQRQKWCQLSFETSARGELQGLVSGAAPFALPWHSASCVAQLERDATTCAEIRASVRQSLLWHELEHVLGLRLAATQLVVTQALIHQLSADTAQRERRRLEQQEKDRVQQLTQQLRSTGAAHQLSADTA